MQYKNHPKRKAKIDQKLLEALEKHANVKAACKVVGIGRSTFYHWQKEDKEFTKACENAMRLGKEEINDFAQSQLVRLMEKGDYRAVRFHLERRHPDYRWPKIEMDRANLLKEMQKVRFSTDDLLLAGQNLVLFRDPEKVWKVNQQMVSGGTLSPEEVASLVKSLKKMGDGK